MAPQPTLFDELGDVPTPPRQVDPGGTLLPPVTDRPRVAEPVTPPVTGAGARRPLVDRVQAFWSGRRGEATEPTAAPPARDFAPGTGVWPPSGPKARARANLAAIAVVRDLDVTGLAATAEQQQVLAAWSGWGAVPQIFEAHRGDWAREHAELRAALAAEEYRAAEASTLNAHYTDPAVAEQVWRFVQASGFTDGRVLEPGCGVGSFVGLAPASATMVGVEQDGMTARIAAALYPSAQIRQEGFETTRVPEGSFAATVGNVPFGAYGLHDPVHNPRSHSVHNHFILKSLALTAPGGYVAVLSSRYTLDAADARARRDMAAVADLVGAVRLPSGAFSRVAGTEVLTDLIVLRKREPGREPAPDQSWVNTVAVSVPADDGHQVDVDVNAYLAARPERVLGQTRVGHGQYDAQTLRVDGPTGTELAAAVGAQLSAIAADARVAGLRLDAGAADCREVSAGMLDAGLVTAATAHRDPALHTLTWDEDTAGLRRWDGHAWVGHPAGAGKRAEYRELLGLRDVAQALITAHTDGTDAAQREQLRGELNRRYDTYVGAHGPINRFTWTKPQDITDAKHDQRVARAEAAWRTREGQDGTPYTGEVPDELAERWDEHAWTPVARSKRFAHLDGGIRDDPTFATVAALEDFDEATQTAHKTRLFTVDVLTARPTRDAAATAAEAVAISMDETGQVDLDRVAALLGTNTDNAQQQLAGVVYTDPAEPDRLVPAARYLSGNVRTKLAAAEAAAVTDPAFAVNVTALQEVMPRTIEASEISVRPGVPWIPTTDYEAFVGDVLGASTVSVDFTQGTWTVQVPSWQRNSPLMTDVFGTGDYDAAKLLEAVANSRPIQVLRPKSEIEKTGADPVDAGKTFAAQAQARKLTERFAEWVFTDDEHRRDRLVTEYNVRFNSLRPARYDGTDLALPGQAGLDPHPHQRDAVARIINEPTVLLDHVVGAGKTGVMFMGAMELRRLGLARQPWIVVPNHLIEQVGREAKQWYPAANVLIAANTDNPERRRRFAAQTATSDWDMVIVPKSVFTAIGVSPQRLAAHVQQEHDKLQDTLAQSTNPIGQKKIQTALAAQEKRLRALTEAPVKDTGLTFEEVGADYLLIDEAHMWKNRSRVSGVAELACSPGSQQAEDLAMKLDVLRERRRDAAVAAGRDPDQVVARVATFATGTPVANSLGEMWVMQSYLRPDLLEAAGVAGIDAWGATFTGTTNTIEMNASGSKLRPVTRVGRFVNVPELVTMSAVFTDVVTRDQVPAALPTLATEARQIISLPATQEVRDFITDLAWRADHFDRKRPDLDNALKVSNDGRNVSLDPRLGNLAAPTDGGRAAAVAEQVMRIHTGAADTRYVDGQGRPGAIPGALQIVFCDRATPKKGGQWSIYDGVRDELVARGMDPAAVRFIHDCPKPADKTALFAQCRNGSVSVLIGSTEKMGTGTNIQDRAIALHHMDVPWRPADLEQREGRVIRQGNQNPEIEILNYVTESTFDTVSWQVVERKSRFIAQLKTGELDARTAEDLGTDDLGDAAAATKAVATGDPRYLVQVRLDDDVKRLSALERAHGDAGHRHRSQQRDYDREATTMRGEIELLDAALPGLRAAAAAPFAITIGGREFTDRAQAAPALLDAAREAYQRGRNHGANRAFPIAEIGGVGVQASRWLTSDELAITLTVPARTTNLESSELRHPDATGMGLLRRVENLARGGDEHRDGLAHRHDLATTRLAELAAVADAPFAQAGELADKRRELETITGQLRADAAGPAAAARTAEAAQRMADAGRQPGWSLELNPTPALLEQMGVDPVTYRAELAARTQQPAGAGARERNPAHVMVADREPTPPATAPRERSGAARLIAQTQGGAREHTPQPAAAPPLPHPDGPGYDQHLDRGEDHGHEL